MIGVVLLQLVFQSTPERHLESNVIVSSTKIFKFKAEVSWVRLHQFRCAYVNASTPASCLTLRPTLRKWSGTIVLLTRADVLLSISTDSSFHAQVKPQHVLQVFHKRQSNQADDLAPARMCEMTRSSGTGQVSTDYT